MNIRSLGYRTDLLFPRFDGEVIDRGDYTVIRTPSNPTFYWGNFLLFDQPPPQVTWNAGSGFSPRRSARQALRSTWPSAGIPRRARQA